jgi:cryptochrome
LIFSPWLASAEDQKKYGCIIGKDYPSRIVDHDVARVENLERMRFAYNPTK